MAKLIRNSDELLELTLAMDEKAVANAIEEAHKMVSSPISYNKEDSLGKGAACKRNRRGAVSL